jgi:hypothetical protein
VQAGLAGAIWLVNPTQPGTMRLQLDLIEGKGAPH